MNNKSGYCCGTLGCLCMTSIENVSEVYPDSVDSVSGDIEEVMEIDEDFKNQVARKVLELLKVDDEFMSLIIEITRKFKF